MSRRPDPDPEIERGRKLIKAMEHLERDKRKPRTLSCLPWLIVLALVFGIAIVLLAGWDRFALVWQHLTRPDSIPGAF